MPLKVFFRSRINTETVLIHKFNKTFILNIVTPISGLAVIHVKVVAKEVIISEFARKLIC